MDISGVKHSRRNALRRANRRARRARNVVNGITSETPAICDKKPLKLVVGCIIEIGAFHYQYLGTIGRLAKEHGLQKGAYLPTSGIIAHEYSPSCDDHLRVKAVFKYKGNYYYIPSSFSWDGDVNPKRKYVVLTASIHNIQELDVDICQKVCPGYLD